MEHPSREARDLERSKAIVELYQSTKELFVRQQTIADVLESLNEKIETLIAQSPGTLSRAWVGPTELARRAGVSTKTVWNWQKEGRFRESSMRQGRRSVEFLLEAALLDLGFDQ